VVPLIFAASIALSPALTGCRSDDAQPRSASSTAAGESSATPAPREMLTVSAAVSSLEVKNVVLIVVDTLRADRVGVYGSRRDTTPALDRLAAEGIRFERAYATAPWTVPSIASIFTGLYPSGHGARGTDHALPAEIDTLAEILAADGFRTAGIISHLIISSARRFAQGFEKYDLQEARLGDEYVSTAGVTARAVERLEEFAAADRPFFLFVHYFDPHYRYVNHPEVDFAPDRVGRVRGAHPIWELRKMDPPLTPAEVDFLEALYDEEVRHTDAGIGRLLAKLEELDMSGNTAVVATADHGEEFLERGWLGHTRTLYEELIRVPLIMRIPGRAPAVVREPVSLVSIAPTLLELLGIGQSKLRFDGESLLSRLGGDAPPAGRPVLAEVDYEEALNAAKSAFKKAIVDGRWKLIRDDRSGTVELYDLDADPGERNDLSAARPEISRRLVALLDQHRDRAVAAEESAERRTLSPAEIEQLRVLGYVSPEEGR
jgi:choline-sulfatase